MEDLTWYLKYMVEKDASDIYITVGVPPMFRIEGLVYPYAGDVLEPDDTEAMAYRAMNERQRKIFEENLEMNLALYYPELGRFRVNIFRQRGYVGMIIRQIKVQIKTIDDLGLPQILKDIVMTKRGLVLVVGATGSGNQQASQQ